MRAGEILSLAVAALIGLLTLTLRPWSAEWWASVVTAVTIALGAAIHMLLWGRLSAETKARLGPATWTPEGKIRGGEVRAVLGVLLLCLVLVGGYSASHGLISDFLSPTKLPDEVPPSQLPSLPIQSRLERFIYLCAVPSPQNADDEQKQKQEIKKRIQAWADTLGVDVKFPDTSDFMQIVIEAKTPEAKGRFISMGIMPSVTKVFVEVRRDGGQIILVARGDIPKKAPMIYGITPDPSAKPVVDGRNLIARLLGVPESACRLF